MNNDAVVKARKDQLGQLRCMALMLEMIRLNPETFKGMHDPQLDKAFNSWLKSMPRRDFDKLRTRQPTDFNMDDVKNAVSSPIGVTQYDLDFMRQWGGLDQELRELMARESKGKAIHKYIFMLNEEQKMTAKPNFKPGDVIVADDVYKGTLIVEYQGAWLVDAQNGEVRKIAPDVILMWKQEIEDTAKRVHRSFNKAGYWDNLRGNDKARYYRAGFAALGQLVLGGKEQ